MTPEEANYRIKQHGAKELSKSNSGREIIRKAAEKYKIDLLQPGHPDFMKYHGAKVIAAQLAKERNERISKDRWAALNERKDFEAREKAAQGMDWKSKRL